MLAKSKPAPYMNSHVIVTRTSEYVLIRLTVSEEDTLQ